MLTNRSKSFMAGCLLSLWLGLVAGTVALTRYQNLTGCYHNRSPLKTIDLTIDTCMSQELVDQLKKFADKMILSSKQPIPLLEEHMIMQFVKEGLIVKK